MKFRKANRDREFAREQRREEQNYNKRLKEIIKKYELLLDVKTIRQVVWYSQADITVLEHDLREALKEKVIAESVLGEVVKNVIK